jgi:TIR domain
MSAVDPSTTNLRFKSAFISHSGQDKEMALAFVKKLEENGCKCWISKKNIAPGARWAREIIQGLRESEVLILLLTEAANKSEHVEREVQTAFNMQKQVIPISFGVETPSDGLAYFLINQQLLDATPDEKGLTALLGRLQGDSPTPSPRPPALTPVKLTVLCISIAVLLGGGWIAWKANHPSSGSEQSHSLNPVTKNTPSPSAAPAKVRLLMADGTTPLQGAVVDAWRVPESGSLQNGIACNIYVQSVGDPITTPCSFELQYTAASITDDPSLKPPGRILVDPAATFSGTGDWKPVLKLPDGSLRSHCSSFTCASLPAPGGNINPMLYVGKNGMIPAGKIAVHFVYYSPPNPRREILGEADFIMDVPPAEWTLPAKNTKIQLLNAEGTVPLEVGTVVGVRDSAVADPFARDIFAPFASFRYTWQVGDEDVPGPLTLHMYALHARFWNEPALDGKEFVIDQGANRVKRVKTAQGDLLEINWLDWSSKDHVWSKNTKGSVVLSLAFTTGLKGTISTGEHDFGLVLDHAGEVIYRSKIKVKVTDDWALPVQYCRIQVLDMDGQPVAGKTIKAQREAPYPYTSPDAKKAVMLNNGLTFGLQIQNNGEPIHGPISINYYLKAARAGSAPIEQGTISVAYSLLPKPLPSGYTTLVQWPVLDDKSSWEAGKLTPYPNMQFLVDDLNGSQGSIPAGTHEVGIELIDKNNMVLYRNVINLKVE